MKHGMTLIARTSFKGLLERCTQPALTQYAPPYLLCLSEAFKYDSRRFPLSPPVSLVYSTNRRSSKKHRENWTASLNPDIFPTLTMSPLCPTLRPLSWRLCDGGMLSLLVCLASGERQHARSVFLFCHLAIPRLLDIDDEYKGYRLPAGSIIIPNAWYLTLRQVYLDLLTALF
jgi:hypothetical protein